MTNEDKDKMLLALVEYAMTSNDPKMVAFRDEHLSGEALLRMIAEAQAATRTPEMNALFNEAAANIMPAIQDAFNNLPKKQ